MIVLQLFAYQLVIGLFIHASVKPFKATYCYKHSVALCDDSYAQPVELKTLPLKHFIYTEQWPETEAS